MTDPQGGAQYFAGAARDPQPYLGHPVQPQFRLVGGPDFRSLGGVATATTVLLGAAGLASLIGMFPFFNRVGAIDDYIANSASPADLRAADDAVVSLLTVNFLVTVATGVLFMIWQYRLAQNAELLRRDRLSFGPGWAIGGWFIPFANFVLPYLQLRQSARASDPDLPPGESFRNGRVPGIVTAWTVLFIASTALMAVGIGMRGQPEDARYQAHPVREFGEAFASGDRVAGLSMLVSVAAAIVAILMVRTVTARQDKAIQNLVSPM